jgi:hypothetical protein
MTGGHAEISTSVTNEDKLDTSLLTMPCFSSGFYRFYSREIGPNPLLFIWHRSCITSGEVTNFLGVTHR